MNSTWFRKLLLSYLPAFFIVVTILFVVFFQTLNEQNRNEAIKANEFLTQQVIRSTDTSLKAIDLQVSQDILSSKELRTFFSANESNVYANVEAQQLIDQWKMASPLIDSIYYYRTSDQFVLGDGSGRTVAFQDIKFLDSSLKQPQKMGKWTPKRSFSAYAASRPSSVISIVRGYPQFAANKSGYIVVNVSTVKLKSAIAQMYNPKLTYVNIYDTAGNNLLNQDQTKTQHLSKFSRYVSPYTGWELVSGPASNHYSRNILNLYNIWFGLAVAATILGILWVIHITRRNYRPIGQLVSIIQASSLIQPDKSRLHLNEFGLIQGALEHLMEETKMTRKQSKEDEILQKRLRFQEALAGGTHISEAEWQRYLNGYQYDSTGSKAFVQVLEIDKYGAFTAAYDQQDQSILKFAVSSVIQEIVQLGGGHSWVEWMTSRRLAAIVWLPDGANATELQQTISEQIIEWVNGNLSFTLTIGMHGMAGSIDEIRSSYEIASSLLQYKAVLGVNRTITSSALKGPQERRHDYLGTIYSISQMLRLPEQNWSKPMDELFGQMASDVLSRQEIESLFQLTQQQINRVFLESSKEYRSLWKNAETKLLERTSSWETLDELYETFKAILSEMTTNTQELRDNQKSRVVICQIRAYIEEHYANPDLSLDHLSDKFMMHTKNISKLFKEEFGENFVDYLIGLRMEKAKQIVLQSGRSLQEISAAVGYLNYNSFNRAFKNSNGVSPSDYRKQNK